MYLGPIPRELSDLTFFEEQIIARAPAKSCIVHLKEVKESDSKRTNTSKPSNNLQRSFKGHIIIYPVRDRARTITQSNNWAKRPLC